MQYTQHEKILLLMLRNPSKMWWLPQDFQQNGLGELFVGYEASARLSELAKDFDCIMSEQFGKYKRRSLVTADIAKYFPRFSAVIQKELISLGYVKSETI
jgi:hypothetical protein